MRNDRVVRLEQPKWTREAIKFVVRYTKVWKTQHLTDAKLYFNNMWPVVPVYLTCDLLFSS